MKVWQQILEHRVRAWKTLAMYSVFLMYGLTSGLLGPTMLDLQLRVSGTIAQVSYILPGRSIGIVAGSLIIGFIYHRVNFQLLTILCMIVTLVCNILIPLNTGYVGLICTFLLNGFVGGLTGSGANVFLIQLWGKENPPFLQALHFSYGVGAMIAPLIGRPFLLPLDAPDDEVMGNMTQVNTTTIDYTPDDVMLIYPYGIVGLLHLIPILFFFVLWRSHPETEEHPSRAVVPLPRPPPLMHSISIDSHNLSIAGDKNKAPATSTPESSLLWRRVFTGLIILFMPCAYGIELTYGSYLTTFAVTSHLRLRKATGAYMTSLYWTMFTFFRLSTVFYIELIGPEANIALNTGLLLLANCIIFPLGDSSPIALWIGSFFMGIGNSSIFASVFGFIENYFPVSSNLASMMMVSSFCGEFVFPVIISKFMADDPTVFLDVTAVCAVTMTCLFAACVAVARLKLVRHDHQTPPPVHNNSDNNNVVGKIDVRDRA